MHNDRASKFISLLAELIGEKDVGFFLQIVKSDIIDSIPYVKLVNGDVLFGKRERVNEIYTDVFDRYENLFLDLGIQQECFGAAYDALCFYHYENCSNGFLKKSDLIKPGCTVLDIGARSGHFAVKASRHIGRNGKVVCIDATDTARQSVSQHISHNDLQNVDFHRCLVGDKYNRECNFYYGSDNETYSGIFPETHLQDGTKCIEKDFNKNSIVMPMKTIDSIVEEYNLDNIGFISLQINGAEFVALKGAIQTLKKFKPNIYSTAFMLTDDNQDPKKEFFEQLIPFGYTCILDSKEELVFIHSCNF